MKKEYISANQCAFIMLGSVLGISLMLAPSVSISVAKQDAWLVPGLSIIPGLLLLGLLLSLNKMYPGQSLVQYSTSILGWPGKLLVLIIIWFFLYLGGQILREIINFVKSFMLFETPPLAIYFFTTLLCAYALRQGIEVIARIFSVLVFLVIIVRLIIHGYTIIHADYSILLPILSVGILPVIRASVNFTGAPVGEVIIVFSMIFYHVRTSGKLNTTVYTSFIFVIILFCLVIQQALVNIGPERAARNVYAAASSINAIEGSGLILPFMTLNWFVLSLCEFILCYYAAVTGIAHWAKLAGYKPLILPVGALFIVIGIYSFNNSVETFAFYKSVWPIYTIFSAFAVPLLLWVTAIIRKNLRN